MAYIVLYNNGKVRELIEKPTDGNDNVVMVDDIPALESKPGHYGELNYDPEKGLYWELLEIPPRPETNTHGLPEQLYKDIERDIITEIAKEVSNG